VTATAHDTLAGRLVDGGLTPFERLGVPPVINACGIYSDLGGSCLSPNVWAAATEINRRFASVTELLDRSGELIAQLLAVEAARVVPGAAAGIALSVGACMTRGDGTRMEQLPETSGMPATVVMQRGHRYKYTRCALMTGARLAEVGTEGATSESELAAALSGDVACVLHAAHLDGARETLPLARVAEIAHAHDVPVVVDAAYMSYPTDLIGSYAASGADLTCFSAKYFWGPNAGGFVYGRPDLVGAVANIDFTRFESGEYRIFGRAFKLDRITIASTVFALAEWLTADHEMRWADYRRRAEALAEMIRDVPHVDVELGCFTLDERIEPQPVNALIARVDPAVVGAEELAARLADGSPRVLCVPMDNSLVFCVETMSDDEAAVVAARLRELLVSR
jgi:D-glucosaminate-6-phosphate ammonia-lyase